MSMPKGLANAVANKASEGSGLRSQQGDGWIQTQTSTFTNWVNVQLEKGGYPQAPDDGVVDFIKNGVALIQALEVASGKKFKRYNKNPKLRVHEIENVNHALDFIKEEGLTVVNIGSEDVVDGNTKLVLGLIWTIIYHYQIAAAFKNAPSANAKKNSAKDILLEWVNSQIPEYKISNFNKDWSDGRALCALVNKIGGEPWLIPNHREMHTESAKRNAQVAIDTANEHLAIPKVLEAEDLVNPALDDLSMMTYVSYFKTAKRVQPDGKIAAESEPEPEKEAEEEETKEVEKAAPADDSSSAGLPPPWERSPDWRAYEGADLGGRCKIRVYSSTTTSSAVTRKNNEEMMRLFERMGVHNRPDFEPWVMVDLMDKADRDKVFEKAGTRQLPMLFVDDEYIGGYDRVMELNETNELEKILQY
ncbi:hypothetical protein PTSG_04145 [Salpingoeca rosetta]|uniref:Calponin-homology (CH) domain-containing protein n=1 Tax=Salpingoeca rosetta (strain ATCC 50818 / BSB-021) TaxID=946362 RepID=F2U6Q8_SALR5|nr:uncharacterized protein PTSG_04145 [Salpingoeca rosetta]EGD83540.1 hypothetical protein PTSG_04145 [Salpingoeca rosetta]|eukprot:XP_004995044.1 hypothetical protein PTSG_04145 [Salpingoeca rosetta]